jgi:hypothetical protein
MTFRCDDPDLNCATQEGWLTQTAAAWVSLNTDTCRLWWTLAWQ